MGAREELYRRYLPKMFGVCYRLTGNRTIAEDLVHDGFMKVFVKIKSIRVPVHSKVGFDVYLSIFLLII